MIGLLAPLAYYFRLIRFIPPVTISMFTALTMEYRIWALCPIYLFPAIKAFIMIFPNISDLFKIMSYSVHLPWQEFKVFNIVSLFIPRFMVHIKSFWYRAIIKAPNICVQRLFPLPSLAIKGGKIIP